VRTGAILVGNTVIKSPRSGEEVPSLLVTNPSPENSRNNKHSRSTSDSESHAIETTDDDEVQRLMNEVLEGSKLDVPVEGESEESNLTEDESEDESDEAKKMREFIDLVRKEVLFGTKECQ